MAAYVLLEPTPSTDAGAAYCTGIGELATTVVMAASYSGPDELEWEGQIDCRSVAGCFRASPLHCASREGRNGEYYRLEDSWGGGRNGRWTKKELQRVYAHKHSSKSTQTVDSYEGDCVRGYKGKNPRHGRRPAKEAE